MTDFGVVSPLVHLGTYPQENLARRLRTQSCEIVLAGENSEQSGLKLVLRIYLPSRQRAMPKIGAALWILVEKKTLSHLERSERVPVSIFKSLSPIASLSLWSRQPFSPRSTHAQDGTLGYTYGEYETRNTTAISHGIYTTGAHPGDVIITVTAIFATSHSAALNIAGTQ